MALSEWDKKNLTGGQQRAVLSYTEAWEKATRAGDAAAARKAHEGAEAIRKQAGYSGGSNGAGFTAAARYARETASDAAKQAIDARRRRGAAVFAGTGGEVRRRDERRRVCTRRDRGRRTGARGHGGQLHAGPGRIASRAASAFAFSFANELLKSAAISARDKQYVRGDLADAQEKYATALEALTDPNATPEQRAALARSAMDHADWARYRLDDFGAAGREAVQAREALTDIIEDLRPYAAGYDPFALDSGGFSGHNTLDPLNITPLQDESFFIGKSLGSRSKNYQIDDKETGIKYYFAEGTRVENPTVFAGYQGTKPLEPDTVAGLVREYGGNPNKWQHAKGIGTLAVGEDEIRAEVHWFQEESVGKVKFKIKRWLE